MHNPLPSPLNHPSFIHPFLVKNVSYASLALLAAIALNASAQDSRAPFVIAPTGEGMFLCDETVAQPQQRSVEDACAYCKQRKLDGAPAVSRPLDKPAPSGPQGTVQVGYTATIQLLGLYRSTPRDGPLIQPAWMNF